MCVLVEYGSEGYLWGNVLVPSNIAPGCVYMSECMNSWNILGKDTYFIDGVTPSMSVSLLGETYDHIVVTQVGEGE